MLDIISNFSFGISLKIIYGDEMVSILCAFNFHISQMKRVFQLRVSGVSLLKSTTS